MGRPPRLLEAGIFHVAAHGSDTRRLFLDDEDRAHFLALLARTCERFELGLISYVLMSNHYHALVNTPDGRLSGALRSLHTTYARDHNRRHGRSAHLFRAHPFVGEIGSSEQLINASRYLARNPVEVGLCVDPFTWPWSSANGHAGYERLRLPLSERDLEAAFGEGRDWRARYREHVRV
jgi:REP element-mobilizing transposase RayT